MGRRTLVCWHETAVMVEEKSTKEGPCQLPDLNIFSQLGLLQDGCICLQSHCCVLWLFDSKRHESDMQ